MADGEIKVVEYEQPGQKMDFHTMIMILSLRSGKLLSELNNVPPGLHSMSAHLTEDDLRPNRKNYIFAVDAIEIKLIHLIKDDKEMEQQIEDIKNDKYDDEVKRAMDKERLLMRIMANNGLLPLQCL